MPKVLNIYSGNLYGGVETMLLAMAKQAGWMSFALCFDGKLSRALRNTVSGFDNRLHQLGEVRLRAPWSVFRARNRLRRLLAQGKFDAVICHSAWSYSLFAGVARAAGIPTVFWLHDALTGEGWAERLVSGASIDLAICNSKYTEATFKQAHADARAEVIYYPVVPPSHGIRSPKGIRAAKASLGICQDFKLIVQVSRMEAWKGHETHLRSIALLKSDPTWASWIVGGAQRPKESEYFNRMRTLARELGIAERVNFVGQRDDVSEILQAADILFQPNHLPEPFGISFIEALYAGVPVITATAGGAVEIVDDTCGRLFACGDHRAFAEGLSLLLGDEPLRGKLGFAARGRARLLCEPQAQIEKVEKLLSSLARVEGPSL